MASELEAPVMPLDEEVEGGSEGTKDLVFCRLGESVRLKPGDSSYDLARPPSRPLELSGSHRLLFLAHSRGFLVARTKDVIDLAKEIKEKGEGGCVEDVSVVDVEIGGVSILALSRDCSTLAAAVGGDIHFFSVASLLNKEKKPSFLCSLGESETVKDFKWQKNMEKSFLILSSHGVLKHGYVNGHLKDVMDNADAVDWSVKGDFIAVARKSTLSILSSNLKNQRQMSLLFQTWSEDTNSECLNKVDSIRWVRDDSIIVGCVRVNEDGNEEGYLVQVITSRENGFAESSSKPVVFSFPELFQDVVDDILPNGCGPNLLLSYLERWEVALASNKKIVDQHLQLLQWLVDENRIQVVALENQHEKYTTNIGLKENGDDNLILGFGVDKFSIYEKIKVQSGTEVSEVLPYCIVLCLTAEGKLMMFHAMRFSDPSDLAHPSISPLEEYSSVEEQFSMVNPLENELPAICGSSNDIEHVPSISQSLLVHDAGKDLPSVRNSKTSDLKADSVTPSKKEEANTKPVVGIHTNQISNLGKLPVQSPDTLRSSLALSDNTRCDVLELNLSSADRGVSTTSLGGIPAEASAASQATIKISTKGAEVAKGPVNSTRAEGAFLGPQSTGKFFVADGMNAKASSFASNRLIPADGQGSAVGFGNKPFTSLDRGTTENLSSSGKPFSLKNLATAPSANIFSTNKTNQNEGYKASWTRSKHADSVPAICGPPLLAQEGSVSGKPNNIRAQQLLENARTYRSSQTLSSEPELSKQFYDVKDMTKELDSLLSSIEREGGFRDSCTILQKDSILAVEEGVENLAESVRIHRKKLEERLGEIQQLQNKMLQVSTRQIYMEGIIKQACNRQYWEIWNRQKLNPEFELKRERILNINQNMTNQLIELERHFNTLEISKFGESGRGLISGRAFHNSSEPSRKIQSLQSVYSTLNSQLAAAGQLSECLSKQMAALNINPPSVKRRNVAKELFESIGLVHKTSTFQTPNVKSFCLAPTSTRRISTSIAFTANNQYSRGSTTSASKCSEPETARRRRDSLDKSLANFEPEKTTVKRMLQEERLRDNGDKPFKKSIEAFDSKIEEFAIIQQKSNGTQATSSVEPFTSKIPPHAYPTNEGIQERSSHQTFETQSNSLFKWSKDLSASPQPLESKSHLNQGMQHTSQQSPPRMPSPSLFSNAQNNTGSGLYSPNMLSIGATHVKNQPYFSINNTVTSSKTTSSMQFDKSASNQTSLKLSSSILPTMTTSSSKTVQVKGQTTEQYNLKSGGDGLTGSSPASMNHVAVNLSDSSLSSQISSFAVPSTGPMETIGRVDNVTGKGHSTEAGSTVTSHPIVSASSPTFLAAPSSTVASSSAVSTSGSLPFLPTSSTTMLFGGSSHSTMPMGETSKMATLSSTASVASSTSSFVLSPFQLQKSVGLQHSAFPSEGTVLQSSPPQANEGCSKSEGAPSQAPAREDIEKKGEICSKSEHATSQAPASEPSVGSTLEKVPSSFPNAAESMLSAASSLPKMPSATLSNSRTTTDLKDGGLELSLSQEDEMEEEAPDTTSVLNLGALGGFGLGLLPPSSVPKPNPFGGSFGTPTTTNASSPIAFTSSPGELFRPASFSLPSAQPSQPSQPVGSGPFSGGLSGGFSGFGQPAQIGAGQQALGSVLGTFGQSRHLGTGVPGIGFASSGGFGAGGFSAAASSGGFASGGFAGAAAGGGFSVITSSSGGFAGAATGGGFAALASGSGGFAGASVGGGFAALASSGGGFASAASGGSSGFGGAGSGGFASFSSNQGAGFSSFGGGSNMGPGRPPAAFLTQMRK